MAAIAEGLIGAVLATTKVDRLGLGSFVLHRDEISALVAAVAEGLFGAFPARTPEVGL